MIDHVDSCVSAVAKGLKGDAAKMASMSRSCRWAKEAAWEGAAAKGIPAVGATLHRGSWRFMSDGGGG